MSHNQDHTDLGNRNKILLYRNAIINISIELLKGNQGKLNGGIQQDSGGIR